MTYTIFALLAGQLPAFDAEELWSHPRDSEP